MASIPPTHLRMLLLRGIFCAYTFTHDFLRQHICASAFAFVTRALDIFAPQILRLIVYASLFAHGHLCLIHLRLNVCAITFAPKHLRFKFYACNICAAFFCAFTFAPRKLALLHLRREHLRLPHLRREHLRCFICAGTLAPASFAPRILTFAAQIRQAQVFRHK